MKHKIIYVLMAIGLIGLLMVSGCVNPCVKENQGMTTGTAYSNSKCCSGLVARAPQGWTGGAWCVKSYCEVNCLEADTKIQGVTTEGIYSVCDSGSGAITATLLKARSCW